MEFIGIYGNISVEDVRDALIKYCPDKKVSIASVPPSSNPADPEVCCVAGTVSHSEVQLQGMLTKKDKELKESEESAAKAVLSIQTFHKQQQALFDEFVLLRQRYDEQKANTVQILWNHCTKYHPDLRQIPEMEEPSIFKETETQVGEYCVGDFLGEGQFATVKDCSLPNNSTAYALKIITKDRITSFTALMRVSNEIDNLKNLVNKYIVSVNKVIHTSSTLYIITEKGGRDLFDFFDEHPDGVPEEWAKDIICCILKGVMYCHENGICHRDLKPENILLSFDAEAGKCSDLKLCDFGLSTKFRPKTLLTDFCGSPGFFAPEMIIHGSYFGDKADVWSTGCILLELVAGHEKFCDVWMCAYDYEILQDKKKFTESINETVLELPNVLNFSEDLNSFILKFLELRTSKRPTCAQICVHPWIEESFDDGHPGLRVNTLGHNGMGGGSPAFASMSPSQSSKNLLGDASIEKSKIDEAFNSLSERERRQMRDYIEHHKDDADEHHHLHLPPIVPGTPSIGVAKKILKSGAKLAQENHAQVDQPHALLSEAGNLASPSTSTKFAMSHRSSRSPLPGVFESSDDLGEDDEEVMEVQSVMTPTPTPLPITSNEAGILTPPRKLSNPNVDRRSLPTSPMAEVAEESKKPGYRTSHSVKNLHD